jgi:hydrogenase maturation protease
VPIEAQKHTSPGSVQSSDGELAGLIEERAGAPLAVVVDAVLCDPPAPGTVHRTELVAAASALRPAIAALPGLVEAVLAELAEAGPR